MATGSVNNLIILNAPETGTKNVWKINSVSNNEPSGPLFNLPSTVVNPVGFCSDENNFHFIEANPNDAGRRSIIKIEIQNTYPITADIEKARDLPLAITRPIALECRDGVFYLLEEGKHGLWKLDPDATDAEEGIYIRTTRQLSNNEFKSLTQRKDKLLALNNEGIFALNPEIPQFDYISENDLDFISSHTNVFLAENRNIIYLIDEFSNFFSYDITTRLHTKISITAINGIKGIAYLNNRVLVLDSSRKIHFINPSDGTATTITLATTITNPINIDVTSDNKILVLNKDTSSYSLWSSNLTGTPPTATKLRDLPSTLSSYKAITKHKGKTLLSAKKSSNALYEDEIWEVDSTSNDRTEGKKLRDIPYSSNYASGDFSSNGEQLFNINLSESHAKLVELNPFYEDKENYKLTRLGQLDTNIVYNDIEGYNEKLLSIDITNDILKEFIPDNLTIEEIRLRGFPADLENPSRLTTYQNKLYLLNSQDKKLWEITPEGDDDEIISRYDLSTLLTNPRAITDHIGRFIFLNSNELWEATFNANAVSVNKLRNLPNTIIRPDEIESYNDKFLVLDTDNEKVWITNPDGDDDEGIELLDFTGFFEDIDLSGIISISPSWDGIFNHTAIWNWSGPPELWPDNDRAITKNTWNSTASWPFDTVNVNYKETSFETNAIDLGRNKSIDFSVFVITRFLGTPEGNIEIKVSYSDTDNRSSARVATTTETIQGNTVTSTSQFTGKYIWIKIIFPLTIKNTIVESLSFEIS